MRASRQVPFGPRRIFAGCGGAEADVAVFGIGNDEVSRAIVACLDAGEFLIQRFQRVSPRSSVIVMVLSDSAKWIAAVTLGSSAIPTRW